MLTLTAPGERAHEIRPGIPCPCASTLLDNEQALAKWNGEAVPRWNRLQQAIERYAGCDVQYLRAVEVQRRGALHLHVLMRLEHPRKLRVSRLRALAIRHGYGHEIKLDACDERAAFYAAKYVSKSSDERKSVPYVHPRTGEVGPGRWRTWVASRRWGETMRSVVAAQLRWAQERAMWTAGGVAGGQGTESPAPATPGADAVGALDPNGVRYTSGADVGDSMAVVGAM